MQETQVGSLAQEDPSPREGYGNPPQYYCIGNPMDRSLLGYSPWSQMHSNWALFLICYCHTKFQNNATAVKCKTKVLLSAPDPWLGLCILNPCCDSLCPFFPEEVKLPSVCLLLFETICCYLRTLGFPTFCHYNHRMLLLHLDNFPLLT